MKTTINNICLIGSFIALTVNAQEVTTIAGSGVAGIINANGSAAAFKNAHDVAVAADGSIYVADQGNHMIRKIDANGDVTSYAGAGTVGSADGTLTTATFNNPTGVCFNSTGEMFVADYSNNKIRKIDLQGNVTTFAGSGQSASFDATGTIASFNGPVGICVDQDDNIYVAEQVGHVIRKITPSQVVTTVAGSAGFSGSIDANSNVARFNAPYDVVSDMNGNLYVADQNNHKIRKIDATGNVTTVAGDPFNASGHMDDNGPNATFYFPLSVDVDQDGNIYVGDYGNHSIRKIDTNGDVTTVSGNYGGQGDVDGPAASARFNYLTGICMDNDGNIIIADYGNNKIKKLDFNLANISSINNESTLVLSPNPVKNTLTINAHTSIRDITIVTVTGEKVLSTKQSIFDVSHLNNGVYFARIITDKGTETIKFIKN
jgi:streptogramin lyase